MQESLAHLAAKITATCCWAILRFWKLSGFPSLCAIVLLHCNTCAASNYVLFYIWISNCLTRDFGRNYLILFTAEIGTSCQILICIWILTFISWLVLYTRLIRDGVAFFSLYLSSHFNHSIVCACFCWRHLIFVIWYYQPNQIIWFGSKFGLLQHCCSFALLVWHV